MRDKILVLITSLLLLIAASHAQSLGDVARQQRQKQPANHTSAKKVITNDDIPEHPESPSEPQNPASINDGEKHENSSPPASAKSGKSAARWKAEIQAQKDAIASFQDQIDTLNASIRFVDASRYANGAQYNQYQLKKQEEVQRMQKQLDGEKKKLEDMQEAARREGFGSAVYDP